MFDTPLRYPGGKGRLAQYVINLIEMNGLTGWDYVEPYAGGAGVGISLLYLEYANRIHLNDLNRSVHAFWKSVLEEPTELCRLIRDTPVTIEEWHRQKAIQTAADVDTVTLGFSTFFLNRTNRSGIVSGGVIGGKNQTGKWKIDARYTKANLLSRIEKIASYSSRIKLYNLDAAEFLLKRAPRLPKSALIYLDPPYYVKGRQLYENHYRHEDHIKIAETVSNLKQKWIVSYDNVPEIRGLYSEYRQEIFGLRYSAHSKYEGTEVMIFCNDLKTPAAVEPWRGMAA